MRRALVPLIALVVLLTSASTAGANQWCVQPATGCTNGTFGFLQTALTAAESNAGPDEIRLGAATYSGGFVYSDNGSATNSVAIKGVSSRATTLTRPSSGRILDMSRPGGARNSVSNLRLHITKNSSTGLVASADVSGVAVLGDPAVTAAEGMHVSPGSVRNTRVSLPLSGGSVGIDVGTGA